MVFFLNQLFDQKSPPERGFLWSCYLKYELSFLFQTKVTFLWPYPDLYFIPNTYRYLILYPTFSCLCACGSYVNTLLRSFSRKPLAGSIIDSPSLYPFGYTTTLLPKPHFSEAAPSQWLNMTGTLELAYCWGMQDSFNVLLWLMDSPLTRQKLS